MWSALVRLGGCRAAPYKTICALLLIVAHLAGVMSCLLSVRQLMLL